MGKSVVSVLKTSPENVIEDIKKLCSFAGINEALDHSATTIIKDNITWHLHFPGANTTPWQMEGTVCALRENGFNDLSCVHNRTVVTDPFKGASNNRYEKLLDILGVPVLYNFRESDMRWIKYEPKSELPALKKIFPEGIRVPDYFIGKNIIHLPTVKTHSYTTYTGALKNAFGGLLNSRRHYAHSWIHETLVDLLALQKEIHPGMFCLIDGTTAGSGPGPRTLFPHEKNVILASSDMVAADAAAAKMMGFDPMDIKCIRLAHERGLGIGNIKDIEIRGDSDFFEKQCWEFKVGTNLATGTGRLLWHSPLRKIQKLFFRSPLCRLFVWASSFYHDRIWYNITGKKRINKWENENRWAELFKSYS
ncbi:MAG: DUF362 domain-containing protein [Fibrobacterota bacterium]